jgi:hypothetical protein
MVLDTGQKKKFNNFRFYGSGRNQRHVNLRQRDAPPMNGQVIACAIPEKSRITPDSKLISNPGQMDF